MGKIVATCSNCRHTQEIEAYTAINVADRPDLKEKVKDGSLFVWECAACGAHNLAVYQILYHDPEAKLMVWLMPGDETLDNRLAALADQLDGYTLRRVSDVGSLIEKVNIHDAGLDDAVIEMCKYVTRMELAEKHGREMLDTPMKFYRVQGADHEIVLSFPLNGAMHGVNIGFHVYEDCRGILQRNPQARPGEGFARVDAAWLGRFFR